MVRNKPVFQNSYFSPAKLNLFLHILGKRADGYHELESLVYFTKFGDHITIRESAHYQLSLGGPYADILARETSGTPNLVTRAVDMLAHMTGRSFAVHIDIEKHIPLGGGLGGGSSNAATVLKALRDAYKLNVDLSVITSALGSDITAFLHAPQPVLMTGTGNEITPLPDNFLPRFHIIFENCGRPCPTAEVYQHFSGGLSRPLTLPDEFLSLDHLIEFLETQTRNDLTASALKICPDIGQSLNKLNAHPDNLLVRMSGSGATCFAIRQV